MADRTIPLRQAWRLRRHIQRESATTGRYAPVTTGTVLGWLAATPGGPPLTPSVELPLVWVPDAPEGDLWAATLGSAAQVEALTPYVGRTIYEVVSVDGQHVESVPLRVVDPVVAR